MLAAGADVNQAKTDGATPLFIAAQNGHAEVVAQLLAAGADVNKAPTSGFYSEATALYIAAQYGHTEVVEQLIAHGADEASLTLEQQTQVEQAIAEARAILIARNNRNSACALADIGQELQRGQ